METSMQLFVDQVISEDRKLNRQIKKQLRGAISLDQLDRLGFATYFYLKNTGRKPKDVRFQIRVVFEKAYLPVMRLKVQGYHSNFQYRLSTACLMAIETKLYAQFENKIEHDQNIVMQDVREVFELFIQSGYLLKDPSYLIFEGATQAKRKKEWVKNLSKADRRFLKHYLNLFLVEEVIQDVV